MNKKLIRNIAAGTVFTLAAFAAALHSNLLTLPFEATMDPQYVTDFSNDKNLMGASHNVFVGRVTKQVGTKSRTESPETQFSVEVISNIKGNLLGNVIVDQFGGYKNGILYVVDGDTGHEVQGSVSQVPSSQTGLLEIGKTYLFATRYSAEEKWHTLISDPAGKKVLSVDKSLSLSQLRSLAQKDARVVQLQEAYKNEVLLDADVAAGNTLNSYKSLNKK